jgi:hypothetical protein
MKCPKYSSVGTGCDLEAGHDGDHIRYYAEHPGYPPRSWSEESDRRFADNEGRKKLGT